MLIPLDAIDIRRGYRPTIAKNVAALAASIDLIGLRIPIAVQPKDAGRFWLVAGRNRIEAYRRLGRAEIEAEPFDDQLDAELWEIAENLHRVELTKLQRSIAIGEWVKAADKKIKRDQRDAAILRQSDPKSSRAKGRPESGTRAAARVLGIPEKTAQRSVTIATGLTQAAQKAAVKLGLDDNQTALHIAAMSGGPKAQVRALQDYLDKQQRQSEARAKPRLTIVRTPDGGETARQAFLDWFDTLDVVLRRLVCEWLRTLDPAALVAELERPAPMLAVH